MRGSFFVLQTKLELPLTAMVYVSQIYKIQQFIMAQ
jgi:hypothetical protein